MPERVPRTVDGSAVPESTIVVVPSTDPRHDLLQASQIAALAALISNSLTEEA
ncbi:MAG: hypothetical protein WKF96_22175 [Solirubrobacteraceae bacterium]